MKVKVTATDANGEEHRIGVFNQGVVVEQDAIFDVASRDAVLVRWHPSGMWVSKAQADDEHELGPDRRSMPSPAFRRVFIQGVAEH